MITPNEILKNLKNILKVEIENLKRSSKDDSNITIVKMWKKIAFEEVVNYIREMELKK